MNVFTVTSAFCCLIFCVFLAIVYFSKKNVLNIETKIYRYIIIFDFILIIFHIVALITGYYVNKIDYMLQVYDFVSRIYGLANFVWCGLLEIYTLLIINEGEEDFIHKFIYKMDKTSIIIAIITFFIIICTGLALPLKFFYVNGVIAYTGPCLFYYIFLLLILLVITIVYIVKNFKKIDSYKKLSPFLFFMVMQIINYIINSIDGTINEVPLAITLTSYFMYHIIENPDIKLITELKFAKDQAEKAKNAKSDFLNSMSLELRSPLNAVVRLSEEISVSNDLNEIHEDTENIINASNSLLEIVNGILDINKLEAGKIEVIENNYDPRYEFTNVAKIVSTNIGNKPIKFEIDISNNIPSNLYGDKEKIKRIIINLLTNAIKYTDSGYVRFNVECLNEKDICTLIIFVEDTGKGIKEESIRNFNNDLFSNSSIKTNTVEEAGLGLEITKSLVEILDGKIDMTSIVGKGTKFTVTIKQKIVLSEI